VSAGQRYRPLAWLYLGCASLLLGACSPAPEEISGGEANAEIISVTGELRSANSFYFGPPAVADVWNYTIAYMAPDGQVVQAGRPILRFDTQELMTKLRDKNNQLNEKQKELERVRIVARETLAEQGLAVEQAKADLDRARLKADIPAQLLAARDYQENQLLLERGELEFALRQEELVKERAIQATEVTILEREVGVLELEAQKLQASIQSMSIMAPGTGVVIHVRDRRNNKMEVGDNVWGGRRVIEFPDLEKLEAHVEIPERESARVKVGQQVRFALDAAPDRVFEGEIVARASVIHTRSTNQPDKVFDVTVRLDNPDPELMRPGMNVNAEILVGAATELAGR
jgi:multidrug resistance efflux pump